jgi:hypothetical protein
MHGWAFQTDRSTPCEGMPDEPRVREAYRHPFQVVEAEQDDTP